jgi:hypothetical protein
MAENLRELIATVLQLVDKAQDNASQLDGSDLGSQLASIRAKLQDLRDAITNLREENADLRDRLLSVDGAARRREDLVRHKGVYWLREDPDPWCPICWEKDQVTLHMARTDLLAGRLCQCPRCGYNVNLDNVYPPREWQE